MKEKIETVLCIPGYWGDWQDFVEKIVAASSDLILINNKLYFQKINPTMK